MNCATASTHLRALACPHTCCSAVTLLENSTGRWKDIHAFELRRRRFPDGTMPVLCERFEVVYRDPVERAA